MNFCKNCGEKLTKNIIGFCPNCGTKIPSTAEPSTETPSISGKASSRRSRKFLIPSIALACIVVSVGAGVLVPRLIHSSNTQSSPAPSATPTSTASPTASANSSNTSSSASAAPQASNGSGQDSNAGGWSQYVSSDKSVKFQIPAGKEVYEDNQSGTKVFYVGPKGTAEAGSAPDSADTFATITVQDSTSADNNSGDSSDCASQMTTYSTADYQIMSGIPASSGQQSDNNSDSGQLTPRFVYRLVDVPGSDGMVDANLGITTSQMSGDNADGKVCYASDDLTKPGAGDPFYRDVTEVNYTNSNGGSTLISVATSGDGNSLIKPGGMTKQQAIDYMNSEDYKTYKKMFSSISLIASSSNGTSGS